MGNQGGTEKNVLDILLQAEIPQPRHKTVKLKRLSKHCGEDVCFTIKQLTYTQVSELKRTGSEEDMGLRILLAGTVEPNLKSKELQERYGSAPTPAELAKRMLLPGEIEDISREIEKLSGYRTVTIENIKKKSETTPS